MRISEWSSDGCSSDLSRAEMTVSLKKDMRMTSQEKYSRVARWLHWIIAVLVIAGLALGLLHERLENVLPSAIPIHKSIGFTVLALTLVRLGWRLGDRKSKRLNSRH